MEKQETRGFQSEIKQLLHLMIHSLYSNKEIFIRELISNASDAVDKLRFRILSQPDLQEENNKFCIQISYDKEERTITFSDNGIGMNRDEVISNLGTIAKSGTKDFLKLMQADQIKDNQLIGQFGVGFYSSFIVASKVIVRTRAAGVSAEEAVFWESTGEGDYTIANIIKLERGTEIMLYLRHNEDEFLDDWRLKSVIHKYSDHIALPIKLGTRDKNNKNIINWEQINKAPTLWVRNKSNISDSEYKEFYKHLFHDFNDPLIWSHNKVEGTQEYTSILFIPTKAPHNTWNREFKHGLKFYIKRVFIMDDAEQFIPKYLRFIKGLIDSNNLPLNISRETLQNSRVVQNIKSALTKRILSMLEKLAKNDIKKYQSFWYEFGLILKEGLGEDPINAKKIAKLLRFSSTYENSSIQNVSLENYVSRMIKDQEKIYYITANSYIAAKNNPHLEWLCNKGIEVLLLFDRIDEWMMSYLTEFEGKMFQSVSKDDVSLNKLIIENKEKQKENKKIFEPFVERIKKYLGDRIKDVRLTNRLIDTPSVITTDSGDITTQMAKLLAVTGQAIPKIKYIFELNPEHPLIIRIAKIEENNKIFNEWIELLFDQSLLVECSTLEDPNQFIRRINYLLSL